MVVTVSSINFFGGVLFLELDGLIVKSSLSSCTKISDRSEAFEFLHRLLGIRSQNSYPIEYSLFYNNITRLYIKN